MEVAVLDYGLGNTKSICSAIEKCGATASLTRARAEVLKADGLVLPGVGAFAHAMEKLKYHKLDILIREFVASDRPFLGICLGMQMLFESSTEFGDTAGLGLIPGQVQKLQLLDAKHEKLPHVCWSSIQKAPGGDWSKTILETLDCGEEMYFVHSYYAKPNDPRNILSVSSYGGFEYCSTVRLNNIYGCQYHPEKSATAGLKIIENFVSIC